MKVYMGREKAVLSYCFPNVDNQQIRAAGHTTEHASMLAWQCALTRNRFDLAVFLGTACI